MLGAAPEASGVRALGLDLANRPEPLATMAALMGEHQGRSLVVRAAGAADLDVLLDLYRQLADDRPESLPGDRVLSAAVFARILADRRRHVLVAEAAGRVVGTAEMLVVDNLTHGGRPWVAVENVVVDQAARGRGVGRALMDEVLARTRAVGGYRIQLLSRGQRTDAHAFYRSLGFETSAVGFRLYVD